MTMDGTSGPGGSFIERERPRTWADFVRCLSEVRDAVFADRDVTAMATVVAML